MTNETRIVILGAGFAGLGMAIKLKQAGIQDFVILERAQDVGGCWRDNDYPGAACDVPSLLYSYSFETQFNWSRRFSQQSDIHSYLKHCVKKYQLQSHIHFNAEIKKAEFDEKQGKWSLTTSNSEQWVSRIFISACGLLSEPFIPQINNRETFKGKVMHSACWDHNYDLTNKKIAVIGTGASAIQFIPEIAKQADHIVVFQRSAPYIIPKPDRIYSNIEKSIFKTLPFIKKLCRLGLYIQYESRFLGFVWLQFLMFFVKKQAQYHMYKAIKDPILRKKFIPDYDIGCKRILISNNFYQTFTRSNVSLETDAISHIEEDGIVLSNGKKVFVDTIIYGTGFKATEFLSPISVSGLEDKTLNQEWKKGAEAYLGITVNGFPNFYMLYGPNTNLGHNSIVYMLESQSTYILESIKLINKKEIKYLNVRQDLQNRFNTKVQQQLKRTVWEKECHNWYTTKEGKNTTNWPNFTFTYRHKTRNLTLGDYHVVM